MLAIAHRAGNEPALLRAALDAGVDLVEADVALYRGTLELRHLRTLGPRLLWDRDRLTRRGPALPTLRDVLTGLAGQPRLLLDLKGRDPELARRVAAELRATAPGLPVAVCTKAWPLLAEFAGDPHVRRVLSVANQAALRRLRGRLRSGPEHGVSIRLRLLTPAVVAELRDAVEHVLAWPVDTPDALAHARRLGVTGVIGKDLRLLRAVVATR
jgi:glycerophosphoryl diester phosphodiesterase